jgi:hypothetical protein
LTAGGGLIVGLSDQDALGVVLVVAGFAGIFFSFYREYWRMAYDESDEMSQEIDS